MGNNNRKIDYLEQIRTGHEISRKNQLMLIVQLSIPAILAQLTTILMEYIDAAMVGSLGEKQSAAIGLVSTSTWLLSGLSYAFSAGFTVQVAHMIGAGRDKDARRLAKSGLFLSVLFGALMMLCTSWMSFDLPKWLGGEQEIWRDASLYFFIYSINMPLYQLKNMSAGMLQCSGNMKLPSAAHILMCVLDVIFNFILIFDTRFVSLFGYRFKIYGCGLGVFGAGLGTALSVVTVSLILSYYLIHSSDKLKFRSDERLLILKEDIIKAVKISIPAAVEQVIMCGAYITSTVIVATLGSISIAAHSFAITAESLCYMPGYGIGQAATTIVGQSLGAGRKKLAKILGWMSLALGMLMMTVSGVIMYIFAPFAMAILTPVVAVKELGARVLRIELFAEPLYGASIVANGIFRGAGDTKVPCILNFLSMWIVRIPLSAYLASKMGLDGVWLAMCIDLMFRGLIFIFRLLRTRDFN